MEVYKIYYDSWGQRGTQIHSEEMTEEQYKQECDTRYKPYFITNDYLTALYYTQD